MKHILLDTGPLVSLLQIESQHYAWAYAQFDLLNPPFLTCEPVLTETFFLLHREGLNADLIFSFIERGAISVAFDVQQHHADLRALMHRYRNRPMSLADACLVRMAEIHQDSEVFTLDSDFRVYRRHGNRVIPVRMPD